MARGGWGGWGRQSHGPTPAHTVVDRAIQSLTDLGVLRRGQQGGAFLSEASPCLLHRGQEANPDGYCLRPSVLRGCSSSIVVWGTSPVSCLGSIGLMPGQTALGDENQKEECKGRMGALLAPTEKGGMPTEHSSR